MDNIEVTLAEGSELQGGKYKIERFLANGGFGNTYLATNTALKSTLVIKEFFLRGISTREGDTNRVTITVPSNRPIWEKQKKKFFHEAQRISRLRHPSVVRVIDLFEENETAYYAMDFVDGQSLSDKVKASGPLTEDVVNDYCKQLLDALDEAHNNDILHLDIKPSNLMVDKNGKITLIDFGASKQVQGSDSTMTTTTGLAFTPAYAPPEQQFGKFDKLGPWSDFYSLGATLYNLLTTLTPPDAMDLMSGTAQFDFPAMVSKRMQDLVKALMNPDVNKRPQSVAEVKILFYSDKAKPEAAQPQPAMAAVAEETVVKQPPKPIVQKTVTTESDEEFEAPSLSKRLLSIVGIGIALSVLDFAIGFAMGMGSLIVGLLLIALIILVAGIAMYNGEKSAAPKLIDVGYIGVASIFLCMVVLSFGYGVSDPSNLKFFSLIVDAALVVSAGCLIAKERGMLGAAEKTSWKLWAAVACIVYVAASLILKAMVACPDNFYYWAWSA